MNTTTRPLAIALGDGSTLSLTPRDRQRLDRLHALHATAQAAEDKAFMANQETEPPNPRWATAEAEAHGQVAALRAAVAILLDVPEALAMEVLTLVDNGA